MKSSTEPIKGPSESAIQTTCVKWFNWQHPRKLIFAIPNGGKRSKAEAGRFKAEGVTAGVPDLFIPEARAEFHGLFVEMKTEKGRLSPFQSAMINALQLRGYKVAVCRSLEEFQAEVKAYFE